MIPIREDNTNRRTSELLAEYIKAQQNIAKAEAALATAKVIAREIRDRVGDHLAPSDIKTGEQIGIWAKPEGTNVAACYVVKLTSDPRISKHYEITVRQ